MRCLPDPATPRRGGWRRTRTALLTAGATALTAQLVPWVHAVLVVLVAISWVLIALLAARALAHRYGLHFPAGWASPAAAARIVTRLAGRLRAPARRRPTPAAAAVPVGQDCYELVGGPVGER